MIYENFSLGVEIGSLWYVQYRRLASS